MTKKELELIEKLIDNKIVLYAINNSPIIKEYLVWESISDIREQLTSE
jgi:hypothetical protein